MIYKSSAFDTYLLAVASAYLGAIPVMTSYHLPTATMEVFVDRLEDPLSYSMKKQPDVSRVSRMEQKQSKSLLLNYWNNLLSQ